jgi:hypothetical protein
MRAGIAVGIAKHDTGRRIRNIGKHAAAGGKAAQLEDNLYSLEYNTEEYSPSVTSLKTSLPCALPASEY